ncbi:MAG TPA: hypothetical protein VMO47_04375 [Rhodothermales bacterium]|nr:hypothetical protein [Rhodothermales bacterium]
MEQTRIGIIGSGFVSRGLVLAFANCSDLKVTAVLTRTASRQRSDYPAPDLLTESVYHLIDRADLVVLACGDPIYSTEVVDVVMGAGIPVVTMDSEFQVTTGSWFVDKGYLTEAEGDQPGTLAAFRNNVLEMGFRPMVYGNVKGFLNHTPTEEEMKHWARRQGISLQQVTSFTDGTKLQIEQALVANAFRAGIARRGMIGLRCLDIQFAGDELAAVAAEKGEPIADYVRSSHLPAGVFIVCAHDDSQQPFLRYLKLGEGPYYTLMHNYHLCHLEVAKTIRQVVSGAPPLLNNTELPHVSVASVAKKRLEVGDRIERGIGSFEIRGEAVEIDHFPDHVPVGLMAGAIVKRRVDPGAILNLDDVELPESKALTCWHRIMERRLVTSRLRVPMASASAAFFSTRSGADSVTAALAEFWHGLVAGQEMLLNGSLAVLGL